MYSVACCQMLVIDLDGGRLLHGYGDEVDIIPHKLHKALVSAITDDSSGKSVRSTVSN